MLKPATPLIILFIAAFVLLLLPTLSTPTIRSIPLASVGNGDSKYVFGLFGYCGPDGKCSKYEVGYSTDNIQGLASDFNLPSGYRNSLSAILIVHPVAALMTLICTALAAAAHFHGPAHSPRFLLGLLIFTFPTLLVTLLAFLVDILLFVPHLEWGGWLVLAATLLITACSVLICAMRRTLVSRKARKRRIAENADMNGSQYYANKPPDPAYAPHNMQPQYARAESPPPMGPDAENKLPQFATYESNDDRTPLNAREPSLHTVSTSGRNNQSNPPTATDSSRTMISSTPGSGSRQYQPRPHSPVSPIDGDAARDPFGNANGPGGPGYIAGPGGPGGPGGPRGAYMGPRGRGGIPPAGMMPARGGRGGFPPRGGFRGRGGPPPGMYGRGGYPPRGPFRGGMRGPPPPGMGMGGPGGPGGPGYAGPGYMGPVAAAGAAGMAGYGRGGYSAEQAPPGYSNDQEMDVYQEWAASSSPERHANAYPHPAQASDQPQVPPISTDVAPPRELPSRSGVASPDGIRRDPASFGFIGPRGMSPGRNATPVRSPSPPPPLPTDHYDAQAGQAIEMDAIPAGHGRSPAVQHASEGTAVAAASPVEMGDSTPRLGQAQMMPPAQTIPTAAEPSSALQHRTSNASGKSVRKSSDTYYEDVDPRFAQDEPLPPHASAYAQTYGAPQTHAQPPFAAPAAAPSDPSQQHLYAGPVRGMSGASSRYSERYSQDQAPHDVDAMLDPVDRTRSPAQSDTSNFTSISQRGINPNWQPAPGEAQAGAPRTFRGGPPYAAARGRAPAASDAILAGPDFALPGSTKSGRGHRHQHSGSDGGRYPGPGAM